MDETKVIDLKEITARKYDEALEVLSQLEAGSREYAEVGKIIQILGQRLNDLDKVSDDYDKEIFRQNLEQQKLEFEKEKFEFEKHKYANDDYQKNEDRQEAKKDRLVKIGIAGAEILVPVMVYVACFKMGLSFEKTGTLCSSFFKNLIKSPKFFK